ncbi:MAG: hypothetical protein IJX77_06360 [Ruminococcus sp.]|nr:hypothetical protein [Ruminococcus sp.]
MRSKFKRMTACLAAAAMSGSTLMNFPDETFEITLPVYAADGDVQINETNFPDDAFRSYVDENFDTTDDDILTAEEIAAVTEIALYNDDAVITVADLTGIGYFTALTTLYCYQSQLTSLDVSKNTALEYLYCFEN